LQQPSRKEEGDKAKQTQSGLTTGAKKQLAAFKNGDSADGGIQPTDETLKRPHRLAPSKRGKRHHPDEDEIVSPPSSALKSHQDGVNRPKAPTDEPLKRPHRMADGFKERTRHRSEDADQATNPQRTTDSALTEARPGAVPMDGVNFGGLERNDTIRIGQDSQELLAANSSQGNDDEPLMLIEAKSSTRKHNISKLVSVMSSPLPSLIHGGGVISGGWQEGWWL
jgi:hypothetical protein